jgi:hypothetical protein
MLLASIGISCPPGFLGICEEHGCLLIVWVANIEIRDWTSAVSESLLPQVITLLLPLHPFSTNRVHRSIRRKFLPSQMRSHKLLQVIVASGDHTPSSSTNRVHRSIRRKFLPSRMRSHKLLRVIVASGDHTASATPSSSTNRIHRSIRRKFLPS